ncbi:hypothetical protein DAEQUDRAFT_768002 [Daedalea quercina L-15889]|uniref:Uncharacterized protein n=1 Tax=Daedalea quercina L-15889 TaxID=1314783 RepID=A0A165N2N9_9APHY|nr:hypothetical protein DAEQUDRAFT_768002 [Daedalea quercina L-15889]
MLHLLFESRSHAILLANNNLPAPQSVPEIHELIHYLNEIFQWEGLHEEILGMPYPTIAWPENMVLLEQEAEAANQPLPPPQYLVENLRLPGYQHIPDNLASIS